MPKYLEVAAEANKTVLELLALVPDEARKEVAILAGMLVNYGVRCNPRPAQSTVRLNAVKRALQGTPVSVTMETKQDGDREFNIIKIQ